MTSKSRLARRNDGQVLLEAVVIFSLLLGSVWINLELMRRAQLDLLLHHAAFLAARARALGASLSATRRELRGFLVRGWGSAGNDLWRRTDYSEEFTADGGWVRLHARFPSLWNFRGADVTKHHFESTRKCLFPLSPSY